MKDDPTVDELRAMMIATRDHLRETVIPKLKKIESTIETRDTWAALIERNRAQNERVLSEAAEMQKLL